MIAAPLFVIYIAFTLVFVFGPALVLRRNYGTLVAAVLPLCPFAVVMTGIFVSDGAGSLRNLVEMLAVITIPWFAANLTGLSLWPPRARKTPDIDCFS